MVQKQWNQIWIIPFTACHLLPFLTISPDILYCTLSNKTLFNYCIPTPWLFLLVIINCMRKKPEFPLMISEPKMGY